MRIRLRNRLRQDISYSGFFNFRRTFFDAFGVCGLSAMRNNRKIRGRFYLWISDLFR